jgi:hypothetical protein
MGKKDLSSVILALILLIYISGVQGAGDSLLRIAGPDGWTKHIEVSSGTTVSLEVLAAKEGPGYLNDQYSDGSMHNYSYYFSRFDNIPFYANSSGRHVLSYSIDGKKSDSVVIDVISAPTYYPEPSVVPKATAQPTSYSSSYHIPAVSLSRSISSDPVVLQYHPVGSHIMNYQNGITVPRYTSQYYFGRDFSLGTIDSNYPGTPFLTQFLADP